TGHTQPIILVSGSEGYLDAPISRYADALATGPVSFFNKLGNVDFIDAAREASNRVDPLRRALRLMVDAKLGSQVFEVDGERMTVADILQSAKASDSLGRT